MLIEHFATQNELIRPNMTRENVMTVEVAKSGHRWADVRTAAAYAACGRTKFWRMISHAEVLAVKHGRKVVVCLDSIDAYYLSLPRVGARTLSARDLGLTAIPEQDGPDIDKPSAPWDDGLDNVDLGELDLPIAKPTDVSEDTPGSPRLAPR